MKKSLFLAALVLVSAGCFAQKNPLVKKAKSYAMAETPDFGAARAAIEEAISAEPTAETYYWAGMIGYQEMQQENYNQMMGKGVNQAKAGIAVEESYNYWLKADELAMIPTLDKKGREVVDQKTRNNIAKKMLEYYKQQELVKYGIYLNEQKDYDGAFQAFKMHISIPELAMMQEPKLQKEMPRDTTYVQYQYYAAIFAVQSERHEEAVALLEQLKDGEYEGVSVNQLQNLINYYIYSGQEQTAVDYLAQAIEKEPNVAQYHHIKGNLNENLGHYEEALKDFENALAIDPTLADAEAGKGRVYYNQAVKMNEAAALISDNKEYKKALDEMNEVFRKSLPHFEKAHEMDPQDRNYMQILKGLYYRFHMDDKYNAISEELNNL